MRRRLAWRVRNNPLEIDLFERSLQTPEATETDTTDTDSSFDPTEPVEIVMIKSIKILLVIAAHYEYDVWQMDVKIAFLNGNLEEEVYMIQPEGYTSKEFREKVCRL